MPDARPPFLTIGMATIDDFDGVYFTVTSLLIHHARALRNCEIVVVDNRPDSRQGRLVQKWIQSKVPSGRYVAFDGPAGTSQARNEVFRQARGQAVLCLDCHVLLVPGAVQKLIDYYRANPKCRDLLCGPLLHDSGSLAATHQQPEWRHGAWGVWAIDPQGRNPHAPPFEIWQQGMGLFSCRHEAWVGFHPRFRGFGGCESYVMEKFRQRGARVLCCPWLRWTHRFQRAEGVPYRISHADRLQNYVLGFQELGIDPAPAIQHFGAGSREALPRIRPRKPAARAAGYAVVGDSRYGGVQMRGRALARHLSCELIEPRRMAELGKRRTIIAIKNISDPKAVREKCDRLIYDPLDAFSDSRTATKPATYWRAAFEQLRFDDILATSPACYDVMRQALPRQVAVHLVPHHCDSQIDARWHDPDGPVVYSGLPCFIESGLDRIRRACRLIGREFKMGTSCQVLQGAALALTLRLPPYNTELNRRCKPQIKLANAAAAGLPVVATDCPAALTLHAGLPSVAVDFSAAQLASAMRQALRGPGLAGAFGEDQYLAEMDRILRRSDSPSPVKRLALPGSLVVYTAIFGGYDRLREPPERPEGVEYVCFTDNPRLKSNVWKIYHCQPSGDPALQAKRMKILAHEVLDCDSSLWVDGSIEIQRLGLAGRNFRADLGLVPHAQRSCIYDEAAHCKRTGRGDPRQIDSAIRRYAAEAHPPRFGLWQGGIIWRRHTAATTAFNQEWWREVVSGTSRDQISLPVVLRRLRLRHVALAPRVLQCHIHHHIR